MLRRVVAVTVLLLALCLPVSHGQAIVYLYGDSVPPNTPPGLPLLPPQSSPGLGLCGIGQDVPCIDLTNVTEPFLEEFVLAGDGTKQEAAMIIVPGGGYERLHTSTEGTDVATLLNIFGISAFVLNYRVPVPGISRTFPLSCIQIRFSA